MHDGFRLKTKLPAKPADVYRAWLSAAGHTAMTGAGATATDKEGGAFTAWDGYITGRNVTLKPEWCIVQAWRTSQFADSAPDSRLELAIHPSGNGSEILLIHTNIPPDQSADYEEGWVTHYFEPMKRYFAAMNKTKTGKWKTAKKKSAAKKTMKKSIKKKTRKKRKEKNTGKRRISRR